MSKRLFHDQQEHDVAYHLHSFHKMVNFVKATNLVRIDWKMSFKYVRNNNKNELKFDEYLDHDWQFFWFSPLHTIKLVIGHVCCWCWSIDITLPLLLLELYFDLFSCTHSHNVLIWIINFSDLFWNVVII